MKKLMTLGLVLVTTAALFTACSKKSDGNSASALGGATIAGASFTATTDSAEYYKGDNVFILNMIGGTGAITLSLTNFTGATGTYTTFSTGSGLSNATGLHGATTGTLHITSISATTVQGTYSFTTTDNVVVSNGSFNSPLKVYTTGSGTIAGMTASIQGSPFVSNVSGALETDSTHAVIIVGRDTVVNSLVVLNIAGFTGVGTYIVDSTTFNNFAQYAIDSADYLSREGQIVVSSVTATNIAGTFSFITTNGNTVTNGVFNIPFTHQ